jgi:hypothetical protein
MHFLDILAEQRIAEAERDGLLKDLPGASAPLILRDAIAIGWSSASQATIQ